MLKIEIPLAESFDEAKNEFIVSEAYTLELEHSLVSLSKWESFFEKPFLGKEEKTDEESKFYIQCMNVSGEIPPEVLSALTNENIQEINKYVSAKMTATWFSDKTDNRPSREIMTAELIYYWMVSMNIPFECQHWHLNRLITLIKVCSEKNKPAKKTNRRDRASQQRALNAQRKAMMNTNG